MEPKTFTVTNKFPIGKRGYLGYFVAILVTSICVFVSLGIYIIAFKPTANQINFAGSFALIVFVGVFATLSATGVRSGFGKREMLIKSMNSTSGDADYNKRLKEAAQGYISGKLDEEDFFKMIGSRTNIEEAILKSLDNIKSNK
jgi:hypothetical protein